jgi:hypothetical protein
MGPRRREHGASRAWRGTRAALLARMGKLAVLAAMWVLVGCGTPDDPPAGDDVDAGADGDASRDGEFLVEDFAVADGATWPAGWNRLGGVAGAGVTKGRAWLTPTVSAYSLGRMGHALGAGATADVEITFLLAMDDPTHQGVGFYVRQNGGYLTATSPHGGGYAVFVEAFRGPQIGLWRERDGTEESLVRVAVPALDARANYRVRFRCTQDGASPQLAARIWAASAAEPTTWDVTTSDATAALQNVTGGIAVDAWNTATPGNGSAPANIFVDNISVANAL